MTTTFTCGATDAFVWDTTGAYPLLLVDAELACVYGPSGVPLAQEATADGSVDYLRTDEVGSVVATTGASGAVTSSSEYGLYGIARQAGAALLCSVVTRFGYAGEYTDPTGYVYLRARYYDPITAQFITVDPLVDSTGSPYGYTGGNPLQFGDPLGLDWIDNVGNFAAGFGDTVTFGGTRWVREQLGVNGAVDTCSAAYAWGGYTGVAAQVALAFGTGGLTLAYDAIGAGVSAYDAYEAVQRGDYAAAALAAVGALPGVPGGARGATDAATAAARSERAVADAAARACSFTGATLVLMADGTHKPIQDIEPGDEVIATDPETGESWARPVTHVYMHEDTVVNLEIDGETITTTEDHPFWNATDGEYQRADELDLGDDVLAADGRFVAVVGTDPETQRGDLAYNLTVSGLHTYHVGTAGVLVHNVCDFSPAVEQGLDHMARQVDAGRSNHIIEGVGNPCTEAGRCAVGDYLSGFEGRAPDFVDTETGAGIVIDRSASTPVVVIQKPWDVHAYHADDAYISSKQDLGIWE